MPRRSLRFGFGAAIIIGFVCLQSTTWAASPQRVALVEVTRAEQPTDVTSRTGDAGLYITEQDGRVVRFDTRSKKKTTALDLTSFTEASGERGLLGIVFHPSGRFMYVNYTDAAGDTVVARYRMRSNGNAVTASRTVLFTLEQPYSNHNGGGLAFGPNGRLYIGTGDGGSRDDPQRKALDRRSLLGKIVSVDALARNEKVADRRIWAIGLRNPWRFEFDDELNLWIADVGQDKWEEVNLVRASRGSGRNANFGWSAYEGFERFNTDQPVKQHVKPVHVYRHGDAGCSISGGTVIRSKSLPSLKGWYVYGDYCSGRITGIKVVGDKTTQVRRLVSDAGSVTAVRTVVTGEVFVLSYDGAVSVLRES